jgi:hypothetical protein
MGDLLHIARAAVMLGDPLRVQTIGFAVSRDGIGAKSINSYLIEQLTRSGHVPEQTGDQMYDATQPKLDAALNRKLLRGGLYRSLMRPY